MKRALALFLASALALAACGGDDDDPVGGSADEPRTVEVTMDEFTFTPSDLDVAVGETVTFVFSNEGAVRHEAVFGTSAEQETHAAEMAEMGGAHEATDEGTMPHDEEMTDLQEVVVEPGDTVEMTYTFDTAGPLMIGCHEPGHWEAGMKMNINVT